MTRSFRIHEVIGGLNEKNYVGWAGKVHGQKSEYFAFVRKPGVRPH
jgi:hypothetical protein